MTSHPCGGDGCLTCVRAGEIVGRAAGARETADRVRAILDGIRTEAEISRFGSSAKGARAALERIRSLAVVGLSLVPEVST